ncbi:SKN1/KRE6 family beta-glucan synthesis-associated protein [Aspergillus brunneoviolaceus CBS 621.78]|uniref:Beta-glucan synthesis-associated n=1 Tax=Aspergillus brunneoviolaceus CBS 621.78 TaxID=1450534 RepID=A0ACD1FY92_9EURO|nr:beta-glucan synthesis-associated [Aspergillus brunneoviolaceus CBS 621.78]RAH41939.1 beta-glucan synthesis-associated [Aspergillus brunneoviolaceus CBS 621.78]
MSFKSTGRGTPHIRLNSGRQDPFADSDDPYASVPHPHIGRALTPGMVQSPSDGTLQTTMWGSPTPQESTEFLIPPRPYRGHREEMDSMRSTELSTRSSRRTSWSSEGAVSADTRGYVYTPFEDLRSPSRAGSDEVDVNTQTVSEKYNIMPMEGLLLFPEDVEKDDYLHEPNPNDDQECDIWNRRGIANVGGLILITIGFLVLFIGYPVMSAVESFRKPSRPSCHETDPLCLDVGQQPMLANIRTGLIDPETPKSAMSKTTADGKEWQLVFSDEFNTPGRTFYDDDDAYFQAVDLWYGVTQDLEWYDPDAVTTRDGNLEIRFDAFANHNVSYRSGMMQSWNKLCFSGGRLEASISLPGSGDVSGFWPGFWAMGNLGRPGYAATTEGMWPYSYHDECDAGITPNQSSTDGINFLPGMRLPACTCAGADHPSPGKSRGAPEIDVLEANVIALNGDQNAYIGSVSQSLQMAPFDIWYMPDYDFTAVYDPSITEINSYRGGPYQQAMSGLTNLNNNWYNGSEYQVYAFEYTPGATGDITWFVGQDKTWTLDARAIGPNGNVGQRLIPVEPLSIVMNLGMAWNFAPINESIKSYLPGYMRFDYIRIYQDPEHTSVTCDPPGYETTDYIARHPEAYHNVNKTTWDGAGYEWPQNTLMHGC